MGTSGGGSGTASRQLSGTTTGGTSTSTDVDVSSVPAVRLAASGVDGADSLVSDSDAAQHPSASAWLTPCAAPPSDVGRDASR